MSRRVAILGDIHGHYNILAKVLHHLGADVTSRRLPDAITVIQVGDMVHKGPDSAKVLDVCARFARANPGRWYQLMSNHESSHLLGVAYDNCVGCANPELEITNSLRELHSQSLLFAAVALQAQDRWWIVTHAGLTVGLWRELGEEPPTTTVEGLNAMLWSDPFNFVRPGALRGYPPSGHADPLWAEVGFEV